MPDTWCLIFSDGTGQRGVRNDADVRNTNVFQMFIAAEDKPFLETFYDPGLGAPPEGANNWSRAIQNTWSKATGWGITANITDCYEALLVKWKPGMKVGLFGFSRGAYTVRCLSHVLFTCGIASRTADGRPISAAKEGPEAAARRRVADEAVAAYKLEDPAARMNAGDAFAKRYASASKSPDAIGVFDTVKSLGLPGVTNIVNPWKHEFHDHGRPLGVPVCLHALSIDENRREFLPVLWEDADDADHPGQIVEQVWFPGVHSDIGGGYDDDWRLADLSLDWMLDRLRNLAGLHIPLTVTISDNVLGRAHNERTGMGVFWRAATRTIRGETTDLAPLCRNVEQRFEAPDRYRPEPLRKHPRVTKFYA